MKKLLFGLSLLFLFGCATGKNNIIKPTDSDKVKIEKLTSQVADANVLVAKEKKTVNFVKVERNVAVILFLVTLVFLYKSNVKLQTFVKKEVTELGNSDVVMKVESETKSIWEKIVAFVKEIIAKIKSKFVKK